MYSTCFILLSRDLYWLIDLRLIFMASKRTHIKTRTGCLTCRRRRIRCDESLPQCGNCQRYGVVCDYAQVEPVTEPEGSSNQVQVYPQAAQQASSQASSDINVIEYDSLLTLPQLPSINLPALGFSFMQDDHRTRDDRHMIAHFAAIAIGYEQSSTQLLCYVSSLMPTYLYLFPGYELYH